MSARGDALLRSPTGAPEGPSSHVVVVGAGKGGVGTSTVSVLLALEGSAAGLEVLLVDMDDGGSSLPLLLGLGPSIPPGGDGAGEHPADRVLPVHQTLSFLPMGIPPGGDAGLAPLRRIRQRRVSRLFGLFDLVVVDGGSRLSSVSASLEVPVGRVVGVTTPDRIALAGTHALFKQASAQAPRVPLELVVNRVDPEAARGTHEVVASAARTFLGREVRLAVGVPEDPLLQGSADPLPFLPRRSPSLAAASLAVGRWMVEGSAGARRQLPPG